MISGLVAAIGFIAESVKRAPIVIQCVPPPPDPWWKWLLPTIVQTVISLLSILAGVLIAVRSFRASKKKEHEQWVRDQKRTEWSTILRATVDLQRVLLTGPATRFERARLIEADLKPAIRELEAAAASCILLTRLFQDEDKNNKFYSFIYEAHLKSEKLTSLFSTIRYLKTPDPVLTDQEVQKGKSNALREIGETVDEIMKDYSSFYTWLRREATEDLAQLDPPAMQREG